MIHFLCKDLEICIIRLVLINSEIVSLINSNAGNLLRIKLTDKNIYLKEKDIADVAPASEATEYISEKVFGQKTS